MYQGGIWSPWVPASKFHRLEEETGRHSVRPFKVCGRGYMDEYTRYRRTKANGN